MRSDDDDTLRSAWMAMEWMAAFAIVPLALLAFVSGVVLAVGTPWGLFRHYWVTWSYWSYRCSTCTSRAD